MKMRVLLLSLFLTAAAHAQEHGGAPDSAVVEMDPIRCWLKTSRAAVQVGEHFNLMLTCAVLETARVKVVPEVAPIEPATIQLAPFEVLKGTRHPDIRSRLWRYFQYEYTLRLINDGFFGQDVAIPAVTLRYTVHMSGAGAEQQGIERSYILPTLPVQIVSLVPASAKDIRDAPRTTFADIDRREFRGLVGVATAFVLFACAALLALLGIVRWFAHRRKRARGALAVVSEGSVLAAAIRVLRRAADEAGAGSWTPHLLTSALAAVRIGGAIACGRPFAQMLASSDTPVREGQIAVRGALPARRRHLVSAATTPDAFDAATTGENVDALREALVMLSEARYARNSEIDDATIARTVESALAALRQLKWQARWPLRWWHQAARFRWRPVWSG
jgi:hypothetical protein